MAMYLTMLGTGSPRPSIERSGPAQILEVSGKPILIDAGAGVVNQVIKSDYALKEVEHLFLTHLHADHVYGYGQFLVAGWGSGRQKLTVIGPKGTRQLHDRTLEMFSEDIAYRTALGFPSEGILDVKVIELEVTAHPLEVENDLGITIHAVPVLHSVLTYAFRFDAEGRAIVFSGDTAPCENLVNIAKGADAIVHDSCLTTTSLYTYTDRPEMKKVWKNLQKEHSTPRQCADTAIQAGNETLILTHFLPHIDMDEIKAEVTETFSGRLIVPSDMDKIEI